MSDAKQALRYLLDQARNQASNLTPFRHKVWPLLPGIRCICQIDADMVDFFFNSYSLISLGHVHVQCC